MNFSQVKDYYSRPEIQSALLALGRDREVAGMYKTGDYGKRPNTLHYPQDIMAMVRSGMVEFHSSLERWSNPMLIKGNNYKDLRQGWDFVIDIDCKTFEHGKIGALAVMDALKKHGLECFSIKFTGGTGWHLGIPWESIPKEIDFQDSVNVFPDTPRHVGLYLKHFTRERLEKDFLRLGAEKVAEQAGIPLNDIITKDGMNPWKVIEIDPVLISPRHLFRMAYSINWKKGLASIPMKPGEVEGFRPEMAALEKVDPKLGFLDQGKEGEADSLFVEALDWWRKQKKDAPRTKQQFQLDRALQPELFPPCIKAILEGISDGKKRSVFVLINFLTSVKWSWPDIEKLMIEWNAKNDPALPDTYITTQIRYAQKREKPVPPPNCSSAAYYKSFGVCRPDGFCKTISNPVSYPFRVLKTRKKNKTRR